MRHHLRALLVAVVLLGSAASVGAATIQDLIKLKAAGLSDDILIALIESDGSVFQLKADDVISLRKQGLSEKVIMAMLATTFKRPAPPAPSAPAPVPTQTHAPVTVNIGDAPSTAPQAYGEPAQETSAIQVNVPQPTPPVVINVTQKVEQRVEPQSDRTGLPMYSTYPYATYPYYSYVGAPLFVPPIAPVAPPVYWGFGGQRRPGTWTNKK